VNGLADGSLAISDDVQTATLRPSSTRAGGTVISIDLRNRRRALRRPSFDSIRYPLVVTLGAAFVASLGLAEVETMHAGVYRGSVVMMTAMAALFWLMWGVGMVHERRNWMVRNPAPRVLDALGTVLFELGARPLPVKESPFRR
jgi:hypothetical protein